MPDDSITHFEVASQLLDDASQTKTEVKNFNSISDLMKFVKKKFDLRDLIHADLTKPKRHTNYTVAFCPFHDDHKTPNLVVYKDHYHCYACGAHGDYLDWLIEFKKMSKEEAVKFIANLIRVKVKSALTESIEQKDESKGLTRNEIAKIVEKAHQELVELIETTEEVYDYSTSFFGKRGFITNKDELLAFVKKYKIGAGITFTHNHKFSSWHKRFIIPYFDEEGNIIWFNARVMSDNDPRKKYYNAGGSTFVYNMKAKDLALEKGFIIVVEGELDCMAALEATQHTLPIVGLPGGGGIPSNSNKNIKDFFEELIDNNVEILILMDPDSAGNKHAEKLRRFIRDLNGFGIIAHLHEPNGEIWKGDINEALANFGHETLEKMFIDLLERYDFGEDFTGDYYYIKNFNIALKQRQSRIVYPTGFDKLDKALGGGFFEGIHVIGGITAGGKTSFALKIAENNALEERPVLFFTYEMSKFELWSRIISSNTSISYKTLKKGEIENLSSEDEIGKIEKISKFLRIYEGDAGFLDPLQTIWTVDEIQSEAKRIKKRTGKAPLIIIDYLQRFPSNSQKKDIRERIGEIINSLQTQVAREVGSPVVVLSSLSRAGYGVNKLETIEQKLALFKETGDIEYAAYTAMLIYSLPQKEKEKLGLFDTKGSIYVVVDVIKNRENGVLKRFIFKMEKFKNEWKYQQEYEEGE